MRASPTVGSASPPVHRAASSATLIASASPSLSMNRPPPLRWIQEISESCRNRLAWRSSALRTLSTAASARPRFSGGHTATRALVPSAARSATATVASPVLTRRHGAGMVSSDIEIIPSVVVVGGDVPDVGDHGLAVHDVGGGCDDHAAP